MAVVAAGVGAVIAGLVVVVFQPEQFGADDLGWSLAASAFVAIARPLLYLGMERGPMSVFAPTMGVVSLAVPAFLAPLVGQTPGIVEVAGLLVAGPAVVLIVTEGSAPSWSVLRSDAVVGLAVLVGCVLGCSSICLGQIDEGAGAMPAFVTQAVAFVLAPWLVRLIRQPAPINKDVLRDGATLGTIEIIAVIMMAIAFQIGNVAVVAALLGFAPGVAVVMAATILKERLYRTQIIGGVLAAVSIVLFAAG